MSDQLFVIASKSIQADTLAVKKAFRSDFDPDIDPENDALYIKQCKVTPFNMIVWAMKSKLPVPSSFRDFVFEALVSEIKQWEYKVEQGINEQVFDNVVKNGSSVQNESKQQITDDSTATDSELKNIYIEATIAAVLYCVSNKDDITITKEDLGSELRDKGFDKVSAEEIFKAMPEWLRHNDIGGRPKKLLDTTIKQSFIAGIYYANNHKILKADLIAVP